MSARPSRAKMCSWLSLRLSGITPILPSNPADIKAIVERARDAESRIRRLTDIASEMSWHVDADLDEAWALMRAYDAEFYPSLMHADGGTALIVPHSRTSGRSTPNAG